ARACAPRSTSARSGAARSGCWRDGSFVRRDGSSTGAREAGVNRGWPEIGARRSFVHDDAALDLALAHEIEGVIDLAERQPSADELGELVLAVHEQVDEHR